MSIEQGVGPRLVKRAVREDCGLREVREGSTGRVVVMLPRVWAVAEGGCPEAPVPAHDDSAVMNGAPKVVRAEVAFYRKYTEAMLRRYVRMSMAAGRVPSLLGRELFRGNVTSYRVTNFEDVVIFCHDVERCLRVLDSQERELIKRVAMQEYSQAEAAAALGVSLRGCAMQYARALDRLTRVLIEARMMEGLKPCQ